LAEDTKTETSAGEVAPQPSPRSLRGLDWFTFFVADVQTGFGPFISVYLTGQKWTQTDIGIVLAAGSFASLLGQVPGGAIVDAVRSERFAAAVALVSIALSALAYAVLPFFPLVFAASVAHSLASCVLGPAVVAISVGLVGHKGISERLGRNARFASLGNGIAAAAMGACAYFFSTRVIFLVTFVLLMPALISLYTISKDEIDPDRAHGMSQRQKPEDTRQGDLRRMLKNRPLIIFAICATLFHFANAAMLPLMGSILTMRASSTAPALIAACIVLPQLEVALLSPTIGRYAERWGRRPLLLIGFAALPLRGLLFASAPPPFLLVAVQLLDGVSAAVLGVLVPLVIVDLTRETGRLNLAQGIIGAAVGIGATLSTAFAGYITDHDGSRVAFAALAAIAGGGLLMVATLMPETRP
jgi:MFS family permease